jgi:hypothetical protein
MFCRFSTSHTAEVIALLAVAFYDGWRPTHHEVAEIVRSQCTEQARRSLDQRLRSQSDPTDDAAVGAPTSDQS